MPDTNLDHRINLADQAFESYAFGPAVEIVDHDNWNTDDANDLTKIAYARFTDEADSEADSFKISFHARFCAETGTLDEAYALEMQHGQEIGTHAEPPPGNLDDEQIKEIFLAHGFTVKPGQDDLKAYVYAAARALLDAEREACAKVCDSIADGDGIDTDGVGSAVMCAEQIRMRANRTRKPNK